ncbi:MAG: hypothetical protein JSV00_04200, partial [bacterium]
EGILPALETAHALAWVNLNRSALKGKKLLLCLSGRGDKDMETLLVNQNEAHITQGAGRGAQDAGRRATKGAGRGAQGAGRGATQGAGRGTQGAGRGARSAENKR